MSGFQPLIPGVLGLPEEIKRNCVLRYVGIEMLNNDRIKFRVNKNSTLSEPILSFSGLPENVDGKLWSIAYSEGVRLVPGDKLYVVVEEVPNHGFVAYGHVAINY